MVASPSAIHAVTSSRGQAAALVSNGLPLGASARGHDPCEVDRHARLAQLDAPQGVAVWRRDEHEPLSCAARVDRGPVAEHGQVGGEEDGLPTVGRRRSGSAAEIGGQGRAEERCVGEPVGELLGDDRHLDRGGQRVATVSLGPQLAPAGRIDRRVELGGPLAVVEVSRRSGGRASRRPG